MGFRLPLGRADFAWELGFRVWGVGSGLGSRIHRV